jgi:hypothetical protein
VTIKESIPGRERMKVVLKSLVPPVAQSQFGNPAIGATRYDLCIYDDALQLVADLTVDQAAQVCGNPPRACWLPISDKGYRYADRDAAADGVQKIIAKGGPAGRGKIVVKAGNNLAQGQAAMPVGVTAALQGTQSATMQVLTSDGDCFGATVADIQTAESAAFRAGGTPIALPTTTSSTSITTSTSSTTTSTTLRPPSVCCYDTGGPYCATVDTSQFPNETIEWIEQACLDAVGGGAVLGTRDSVCDITGSCVARSAAQPGDCCSMSALCTTESIPGQCFGHNVLPDAVCYAGACEAR